MEKTESNEFHPTFHPQDFDPGRTLRHPVYFHKRSVEDAKRARGTVQELAEHFTRCMAARHRVWTWVDEALKLFFPRSKLQQRLLDAQPVAPPFLLPAVPLLVDKSLETTRLIALAAFREENNISKQSDSPLND